MEIEQHEGSVQSLGGCSSACDGANSVIEDKRSVIEQGCSLSSPIKRKLIEVFSVGICKETWRRRGRMIFGFAILKPSDSQCHAVIFRRMSQALSIVNKQGSVMLNGPTSGVEVKDEVAIYVCLWNLLMPMCNTRFADTLWRAGVEETDQLICKEVNSVFGPLEVAFAVYKDGVEAQLDVFLANWNACEGVEAFGDVEAGNSNIVGLRARSSLFHKSWEEAIQVMPGSNLMSLPLSRYHIPILANLSFQTMPAGTETQYAFGRRGDVGVRVTWSA